MTKNRNGLSDGALAFTVHAVTLGTDEDGDPVAAPICDPADDAEPSGPRLIGQARMALRSLHDLIEAESEALPGGPAICCRVGSVAPTTPVAPDW